MEIKSQPIYYVAFFETKYKSFEDIPPEEIRAHIERTKELHNKDRLIMAGSFRNNPDETISTMGVFYSRKDAEDYARGDRFVLKGMVSRWYVKEWTNIVE